MLSGPKGSRLKPAAQSETIDFALARDDTPSPPPTQPDPVEQHAVEATAKPTQPVEPSPSTPVPPPAASEPVPLPAQEPQTQPQEDKGVTPKTPKKKPGRPKASEKAQAQAVESTPTPPPKEPSQPDPPTTPHTIEPVVTSSQPSSSVDPPSSAATPVEMFYFHSMLAVALTLPRLCLNLSTQSCRAQRACDPRRTDRHSQHCESLHGEEGRRSARTSSGLRARAQPFLCWALLCGIAAAHTPTGLPRSGCVAAVIVCSAASSYILRQHIALFFFCRLCWFVLRPVGMRSWMWSSLATRPRIHP